MQYANHKFEESLIDSLTEKCALLPKENLDQQSLQCRPKYRGCFTTTDFFSSHCHLVYKSITTGMTPYIEMGVVGVGRGLFNVLF
jgi:hypothetical protein